MMWWMTWVIGGMMAVTYWLLEDEAAVEINKILNGKGKVKRHDKKNRIYEIEIFNGYSFKDLQDTKGKIENLLKREVMITNENFKYYIKPVIQKNIPTVVPFQIINTKETGFKVAVAIGSGKMIYLDFVGMPHTLIGGTTGWGKSIFVKNLILQILSNFPDCELELFDFKGGVELSEFKRLKQTKSFTIKPYEAISVITEIYEQVEERLELLDESNSRDWMVHNKKSNKMIKPKFVIIEEFMILLGEDKEIKETLIKLLAISRAVGIYFIFTSQRFDAKIIDPRIKANIDNRICFHTADSINSSVILDQTGAERLNTVGRCLISLGGEIEEGQTPFVTEDDVQNAIKSHLKPHREVEDTNSNKSKGIKKGGSQEPKNTKNEGVILWG